MTLTAFGIERKTVKDSFTGYTGRRNQTKLQNRSGSLRRSIGSKVTGSNLGSLVGKVFASTPYAKAHEYGRKPLYSKRGKKFYVIPAKPMLTRAGVQKRSITSWKGVKGAFFLRLGRKLFFAKTKGKKQKIEILYSLFPFPTKEIKPRLHLRRNARTQVPKLRQRLIAAIQEAFK